MFELSHVLHPFGASDRTPQSSPQDLSPTETLDRVYCRIDEDLDDL